MFRLSESTFLGTTNVGKMQICTVSGTTIQQGTTYQALSDVSAANTIQVTDNTFVMFGAVYKTTHMYAVWATISNNTITFSNVIDFYTDLIQYSSSDTYIQAYNAFKISNTAVYFTNKNNDTGVLLHYNNNILSCKLVTIPCIQILTGQSSTRYIPIQYLSIKPTYIGEDGGSWENLLINSDNIGVMAITNSNYLYAHVFKLVPQIKKSYDGLALGVATSTATSGNSVTVKTFS